MTTTTDHTCHGAVFCGFPRAVAERECPACTPTVQVTAREVRAGDVVHEAGGTFQVRHAMTTGKKARVTTLAPWGGDPRHYRPDQLLAVEREA